MALPPNQVSYVSPDQVAAWRDANEAVIVDVREAYEWEEAHIPGAFLMPLSTFDPAALPDPGAKHLVIHCRSGQRCGIAAAKAVAAGYQGVIKRMAGGFQAWSARGYDQEQG